VWVDFKLLNLAASSHLKLPNIIINILILFLSIGFA
jgi:hypothetical protein